MNKPDGLSRCLGEEKSGIDVHFINEEQVLDLKNDDEEDGEDVELEGIDVVRWEKKNTLWVVPVIVVRYTRI